MTDDTYLSLAKPSEGLYKEKGSKFIALAFPVISEKDISLILDSVKKTYHDARHHCYAYRLGKEGEIFKANDDGEPKHSAGDPILGQLRSFSISNVLVIVVRYFGGTKLGIGGLITAYKTATADAINNGVILKKIVSKRINIQFPYAAMNAIMSIIKHYNLDNFNQVFEINCQMDVEIRDALFEEVIEQLKKYGKISPIN